MQRECTKCHQPKQWPDDFYETTRSLWCRDCFKAYYQSRRRQRVLNKHGITQEQYDEWASQGCNVCGGPPSPRYGVYHIDHCHVTGIARGTLCDGCNTGIGLLKDDPALLRKAAAYLEERNGRKHNDHSELVGDRQSEAMPPRP